MMTVSLTVLSRIPLSSITLQGEEFEVGQGELRLQALRKQLKRTTVQCDALKAEVAEGKRRDRTADLYKKKVTHLLPLLRCKSMV